MGLKDAPQSPWLHKYRIRQLLELDERVIRSHEKAEKRKEKKQLFSTIKPLGRELCRSQFQRSKTAKLDLRRLCNRWWVDEI